MPVTDDPLESFKQTYFTECEELLADLEDRLGLLTSGDTDPEIFHAIFRAVHSMKAGAAAFDFTHLVAFSHNFETLLDDLRSDRLSLSPDLLATMIDGVDLLADLVNCARSGRVPDRGHDQEVAARIAGYIGISETPEAMDQDAELIGDFEAVPDAETVFKIRFKPKSHMLRTANEPILLFRELESLGDLSVAASDDDLPDFFDMEPEDSYLSFEAVLQTSESKERVIETFEFVEDDCDLEVEEVPTSQSLAASQKDQDNVASQGREISVASQMLPEEMTDETSEDEISPQRRRKDPVNIVPAQQQAGKPAQKPGQTVKQSSIRVDVDRVDHLVNMVGELVISQSVLAQEIINTEAGKNLRITNGLDILASHVRDLQDQVMSIRMQPVKSLFARLPRIVRDISRKLDKDVRLDLVGETTEVDKTVIEELADPITHMLRNSLDHGIEDPDKREAAGKPRQGSITLSAEHVGGRIHIKLIDDGGGINRKKVLEKAIERGLVASDAKLSHEEIDNLIFLPGFSTAEAVSDLSGRGVGMDVVRRNIQRLGGRVSVKSQEGIGSEFVISLPLTLAVLDGMIVCVGPEKYVVPIGSIIETVRPAAKDIKELPDGRMLARMRGEYIPLVHLADVFDVQGAECDPTRGLVVFVEADGGRTVGLVIDYLVGQQQVVIKSLESNFRQVDGISSATILGDGSVYLIIDVDQMADMSRKNGRSALQETRLIPEAQQVDEAQEIA